MIKTPIHLFKDFVLHSSNNQKQSWTEVGANTSFISEQVDGFTERHVELRPVMIWLQDFLLELLSKNVGKSGHILDYGCGSGRYLKFLEDSTSYELTGIDFSETTLKNYTSKTVTRSKLFQGDFTQDSELAEKYKNQFDAVYSITVLQYVTPYALTKLFDNFGSVLKQNGVLVLCFPIPTGALDIFRYYHYVRYPPKFIERIFLKRGYKIEFSGQVMTKEKNDWFCKDPQNNHGYFVVGRKL